jgi:cell cycle checkpoint protein
MAAPPAKRQRRLTVLSSSDEDSNGDKSSIKQTLEQEENQDWLISASHFSRPSAETSSTLPSRTKPKNKPQSRIGRSPSTQGSATPTPSPEKKRKGVNRRSRKDESASSKSLHSFFQPATEEQRWERRNVGGTKSSRAVIEEDIIEDEEGEDLIEDDFSDDGLLVMSQLAANASANGSGGFGGRSTQDPSREREKSRLGPVASGVRKSVNKSTKKRFILPPSPAAPEKPSQRPLVAGSEDLQPWAERFAPLGLDELAVHKRKVTDVQRWLEDVFLGRNRRVCILRLFLSFFPFRPVTGTQAYCCRDFLSSGAQPAAGKQLLFHYCRSFLGMI